MTAIPSSTPSASRSVERLSGRVFLATLAISVSVGLVYALIGRLAPEGREPAFVRGLLQAQAAALGPLLLLPSTLGLLTAVVLPSQLVTSRTTAPRWGLRLGVLFQVIGLIACFGSIMTTGAPHASVLLDIAALSSATSVGATALECLALLARREEREATTLARALHVAAVAALLACVGVLLLYVDRFAHGGFTAASTTPETPMLPAGLLLLPAMGVISEVAATFSRRPIVGVRWLGASLVGVAFVALATWAFRWFAAETSARVVSWAAGPCYGAFGGLAVVSWFMTLRGAGARLDPPMVWTAAAVAQLAIGLLLGFALWPGAGSHAASLHAARDQHLFTGATLFAAASGLFYWFPRFCGRVARGAPLGAIFTFVGFQVALVSELIVGLFGVPLGVMVGERQVAHLVEAGGLATIFVGLLLVGADLVGSYVAQRDVHANPWDASAPEWQRATATLDER